MATNQSKLHELAKHLNDLNKYGQVKGFQGNENGYAKIVQICRGCSVWFHNEKNGKLIIDLLISPSAQSTHPQKCNKAVEIFKDLFSFSVDNSKWSHSIDSRNEHARYFIDVSGIEVDELIKMADKIKKIFA